ncbi:MAG: DUF378 domain-containing protein [Patescibacteria group bacterium]
MKLDVIVQIILAILIIGGLNWGLIALFDFDLIAVIFGQLSLLSRLIYGLVGLSALYMIYILIKAMAE